MKCFLSLNIEGGREKETGWWYAERKHNSKSRKSCELWLRVNSIATGWFKFMLGKSFIFSFLRRIWDKSLNTWKTRKFKQCVFLSFHSGNFSFVIHFSPTAPWSLGAHMGCGKREDAGRCIIWLGKTTIFEVGRTHKMSVVLSSNCKFQFSWKRRPQICKSLLRVLRWIRFRWAERQIFFKKLWYKNKSLHGSPHYHSQMEWLLEDPFVNMEH